jgi:hypothetical protein
VDLHFPPLNKTNGARMSCFDLRQLAHGRLRASADRHEVETNHVALLFSSHRWPACPNNHKGIDLSGKSTAREGALTLARDLKYGGARETGIGLGLLGVRPRD